MSQKILQINKNKQNKDMIKRNVMQRVKFIFAVRRVQSSLSVKLMFILLLVLSIGPMVSVPDIIENVSSLGGVKYVAHLRYLMMSFFRTEILVKISLLMIAVTSGAASFDILGRINSSKQMKLIASKMYYFLFPFQSIKNN